jgi:hypothetical protein
VSLPTVLRGIDTLTGLGPVQELTGRSRHKLFVYKPYLDILSAGTEPIGRWAAWNPALLSARYRFTASFYDGVVSIAVLCWAGYTFSSL